MYLKSFPGFKRSSLRKTNGSKKQEMKIKLSTLLISFLLSISAGTFLNAQNKIWTVDDCIQYALEKNIQVQKALVRNNITNSTTGSTVFKGTNGVNISASSGMTIYNGSKIRNNVKQSETNYEADKYNTEVIKETVSLNVLNAYLQVLYAEELVKNSQDQISSLEEQLNLASERLK